MSITDHKLISTADLAGPMSQSEYLKKLLISYDVHTKFAERHKSTNITNQLSHLSDGWIVAVAAQYGVLLYDSIQNTEKYIASLPAGTTAWVAGRRLGEAYYTVRYNRD